MDGLYAETLVKRKPTAVDGLKKFGMIAGIVVSLLACAISQWFILAVLGFALLIYFFFNHLNTDYEYIFCDGQLDFDKISGGDRRKRILRVDFDNLAIMAPKNSHALDGYKANGATIKDFSSLEGDAGVYGAAFSVDGKNVLVYFQPDEKMLSAMKQKAPRKIAEY